jgi:TerF-like vWA domain-containing protein
MGLFGNPATPAGAQRTVTLTKDPSGAPAVDLIKVRDANPDLAKSADKVGFALSAKGLSGTRAKVVALLDHSGSMKSEYRSGAVDKLFQRIMGLGLQIDDDGEIPVIPFDDRVRPTFNLNAANFTTAVGSVWNEHDMGSTNLAGALSVVFDMAKTTDEPIFLVVLTDGNPDNKSQATKVVCEMAGYPVFIKFMALKPVDYLSELDDLDNTKRLLDNVDAKPEKGSDLNLLTCTDAEFAAALVDELDTWITAATAAGVLKS